MIIATGSLTKPLLILYLIAEFFWIFFLHGFHPGEQKRLLFEVGYGPTLLHNSTILVTILRFLTPHPTGVGRCLFEPMLQNAALFEFLTLLIFSPPQVPWQLIHLVCALMERWKGWCSGTHHASSCPYHSHSFNCMTIIFGNIHGDNDFFFAAATLWCPSSGPYSRRFKTEFKCAV